ncbi:hypothetical protein RhiirC2_791543 [Rhizophagus irregularis]|uniref:Uncharacterized protein n=1 Tax=Rhizophagus irregularis TaxID=588596 RepID=A0A2N1MJ13_9GLOM|nr:hypothetical protein RhiirC2_791543 [Rhizophagus irregularis]
MDDKMFRFVFTNSFIFINITLKWWAFGSGIASCKYSEEGKEFLEEKGEGNKVNKEVLAEIFFITKISLVFR